MANERFIVNAENAKAIGRLVINTKSRFPIIFDPKSGLNLFKRDAYFEIPTGQSKTGLDTLYTQGCLTWLSTGTAITAFSFDMADNVGLTSTSTGVVTEGSHTIAVTVPAGTVRTALKARFTLSSGATADVVSTAQVSGTTANNFTSPVTYTVTAADARTQAYIVTVTVSA